jgi:hypothetical protein
MKIIHPTPINRAIARRVRGRQAPGVTERVGAGPSPLHPDLVSWVGDDPRVRPELDPATLAPSPELLADLAMQLEAGETHYTTRPGLVELRRGIADALADLGLPDFGVDGVVVTAGEGEALFATLLSLDVKDGGEIQLITNDTRHAALLTILGVREVSSGAGDDEGVPRIVCLWRAVGFEASITTTDLRPDDLFVGTLDGLPGMPPFRLGFAAGAPHRIRRVMTWKQAWSICSPAPSQRAALFAMAQVEGRAEP